jgi:hypothetical protein
MPPGIEDERALEGCGLGCVVGLGGLVLFLATLGLHFGVGLVAALEAAYYLAIVGLLFRSRRPVAGMVSLLSAALFFLLLTICGGLLSLNHR